MLIESSVYWLWPVCSASASTAPIVSSKTPSRDLLGYCLKSSEAGTWAWAVTFATGASFYFFWASAVAVALTAGVCWTAAVVAFTAGASWANVALVTLTVAAGVYSINEATAVALATGASSSLCLKWMALADATSNKAILYIFIIITNLIRLIWIKMEGK